MRVGQELVDGSLAGVELGADWVDGLFSQGEGEGFDDLFLRRGAKIHQA